MKCLQEEKAAQPAVADTSVAVDAAEEVQIIRYTSGDLYEGGIKDGKCHGRGKMTYADGSVCEGRWWNSKRIGRLKKLRSW